MIPYLPSVEWYVAYLSRGGHVPAARRRYHRSMDINRCQILMPDGPQVLTIPLVAASTHGDIDDILVSEHGRWRSHHWNALQTAYGKTPFFEYYADDFRQFYASADIPRLADFNARLHATVCRLVDTDELMDDARHDAADRTGVDAPAIEADVAGCEAVSYYQVFGQRLGFRPRMSIVDLLFNMGPESLLVLAEWLRRLRRQ